MKATIDWRTDLELAVDTMRRHHYEEDSDWFIADPRSTPRVMRGDMANDYSVDEAIEIARKLEPKEDK